MKIQWNSQNYQVANTLFAFIYDQNLNVWNGSAFVATGSTTAAACAITMSQIAGTVWYDANVPAAIQPGFYQVIFCDLAVAAFTPSIGSNPLLIPTPGYTPPSPGAPQTPAPLGTSYIDLVNQVGDLLYKMKPTASDVITDGVAGSTQATEILRAIRKGLQQVYYPPDGYRWSFLRTVQPIETIAAYSTGTITVDTSGNVALLGAGAAFPSYAASSGGQIWIGTPQPPYFDAGIWQVATYVSSTALTLLNYTGPAFNSGTGFPGGVNYSLSFNRYQLPNAFDDFTEDLTESDGGYGRTHVLERIDELQVRKMLQRDGIPRRPEFYALTTTTPYGPNTSGSIYPASTKFISFYPCPGLIHTFSGKATLRPTMLDAVNAYPIGDEILAPCILESCLAAAERDCKHIDAAHKDATHSRAFPPLLAAAIQQDKVRAAPNTLGIDRGGRRRPRGDDRIYRGNAIYFNNFGGVTGWQQ